MSFSSSVKKKVNPVATIVAICAGQDSQTMDFLCNLNAQKKSTVFCGTPWYINVEHLFLLCSRWSRESDLNRRPDDYKSTALPLSYPGVRLLAGTEIKQF